MCHAFLQILVKPAFSKVIPSRIRLFNHLDFLTTQHSLDCFLSPDRLHRMWKLFEVDETIDLVPGREISSSAEVLVDSAFKVVGDTDVKTPRLAGKDVDVKSAHSAV